MGNLRFIAYRKLFLSLSCLAILILGIVILFNSHSLIGKTFPGFSFESTMMKSPSTPSDWSGFDIPDYNQVTHVNGQKIQNINNFKQYIQSLPPKTLVEYTLFDGTNTFKKKIFTVTFSWNHFLLLFVYTFIIGMFYLLTGLFVTLKGKNDELSNTFIIFTSLFAISIFGFQEVDFVHVVSSYFVEFSQIFTLVSLLHLGLVISKRTLSDKIYYYLRRVNIVSGIFLVLPLTISTFFLERNLDFDSFLNKIHSFVYFVFVYYLAISFLLFVYLIYRTYLKSPEISLEKFQSRVIFTGSLISFTPYIFSWLIPVTFGYNSSYSWEWGIIPFVLFPVFLNYAIVRHKAFDIEFFIRKGLIYSALSLSLTVWYFIISTIIYFIGSTFISFNEHIYIAISAIFATIFTGKFEHTIQSFIDKSFYRQKFNLSETLENFVNEVNSIFSINELINLTFKYINSVLSPKSIALYSINSSNFCLIDSRNSIFPEKIPLTTSNKELEYYFEKRIQNENSVLLHLNKDKETIGFIFLGEKMSEVEYLIDEKNFLKNLASALSMAFISILLKNESVELAEKNAELESKAQFLNNLVANLSHDLKFPVSTGKTIINKLKYLINKKSSIDNNTLLLQLDKISRSFEKINEYAETFIDHELHSLHKLEIKSEEVNVIETVNDSLLVFSDYIERSNIFVEKDYDNEDLYIEGDKIRCERTILNLLSNAIKYGKNYIKISIRKSDENIIISVKDNGLGISTKIRDCIFERYTKDNKTSESSRERSTGLGLFICKTYINMMKGDIYFETEEDKGTTFFIKLPLLNKSTKDDSTQEELK